MQQQFISRMEKVMDGYEESGINPTSDNDVVISLTSYPPRMASLHLCLFSLLNQTVKPQKLLLWLAEEQFPGRERGLPEKVLRLRRNGLEIRWCQDYRSYKKLVPALRAFSDKVIVTADDDNFYPPNWLETLYDDYRKHGSARTVHAHRVHHITFDDRGRIRPYTSWIQYRENTVPESFLNFATGLGGILYPPDSLYQDVLRDDIFMRLAPYGDDIFFWAMALLQGSKVRAVPNGITADFSIAPESPSLWSANVQGGNDAQLNAVLEYYPDLEAILRHEYEKRPKPKQPDSPRRPDFSSASYWEQRYREGGNSGAGSYNRLMEFKASVINDFIRENKVASVIDFGVGDGNQLLHLQIGQYTGFDVSTSVLERLVARFAHDPDKKFLHVSEYADHRADMALSLDVIYHLVEDEVFHAYMSRLFDSAERYVIIYSSNVENYYPETTHVRHRKFTKWVAEHKKDWTCARYIKNAYPLRHPDDEQINRSFSDFYIFEKK